MTSNHRGFGAGEVERLFGAAYDELRRLAAAVRRNESAQTLNPTALVHEAYVKLASGLGVRPDSRLHFKRIVARAMRQVLVEASRRRLARKRGGDLDRVTFDESRPGADARPADVIALDGALDELARTSPRQAALVECRFFGGFDVGETAEILGVSASTVDRDWRAARAWLSLQLRHDR